MLPGDRLACFFVQPLQASAEFSDWPPHITIVPWFRADIAGEEIVEKLQVVLSGVAPFQVKVGGEAGFGYRGKKTVNLIKQPSPLESIEQKVRSVLHNLEAWIVDETTKKQRRFRPHVTVLKTGRVHENDTILCDTICIIEQKGNYKKIVGQIYL